MKRILSAVLFLPFFYFVVVFSPASFAGLLLAAGVLGLLEIYRLAAARGLECNRAIGILVVAGVLYSFYEPTFPLTVPLLLGVVGIPVWALLTRGTSSRGLAAMAVTLFGALFLGVLFGYQIVLRKFGGELGRNLVFLLYLVVWTGDTAAYYLGRALGRHRLSPEISPNKTVEGAVAGVAGSLLAAGGARLWFLPQLTWMDCLAVGFLLAGAGVLGDLVESMWKREAGAKDSASLVPGHGGILDRSDSLLFGAPILYYYSLWML